MSRKSRRSDARIRELEKQLALAKASRDLSNEAAILTSGLKQGQPVTGIQTGTPADYFGPANPVGPMYPPEAAGRLWDYSVGWNLQTGPRQYEAISFFEMRALADAYDVLRIVIETRKDQMERLNWSIKPKTLANGEPATADDDPAIQEITNFLKRPDLSRTWKTWLRMVLEDLFVLDAPTILPRKTRGGSLYSLEVMDGGTISRVIDDWGRTPLPPVPAYKQILKGVPATYYGADELIYLPRNQRSHKAYGYSPVEQIIATVSIGLRREVSTIQYWSEGNVPEALVSAPETWTPDQIGKFQSYWDNMLAGNTAQRRHMKFIPGGMAKSFVAIKEPELWQKFDEWIARIVCYAFSIPPTPFVTQVNRATAVSAHDAALEEGLAPVQNYVKGLVDDEIIGRYWASKADKVEFEWDDDREIDPAVQEAVLVGYTSKGIYTINEARDLLGKDPMKGGEELLVLTANGYVPIDGSPPVGAPPPPEPTPPGQVPGAPPPKPGQAPTAPQAAKDGKGDGGAAAKAATFRRARHLAKNSYWGPPRRAVAPNAGGDAG